VSAASTTPIPIRLHLKVEDEVDGEPVGPLLIEREGVTGNYSDDEKRRSPITGLPRARWYTLADAQRIADEHAAPLVLG